MHVTVCSFNELTTRQLYEILRLRSEVFIVEQQGCYLDPDGIDPESIHIFIEGDDHRCLGCIRVFPKPDEPGTVQLGRLAVSRRRQGLGTLLMQTAEETGRNIFGASRAFLTGRRSAREFYEACGYRAALPPCCQTEAEARYFEFRRSL